MSPFKICPFSGLLWILAIFEREAGDLAVDGGVEVAC